METTPISIAGTIAVAVNPTTVKTVPAPSQNPLPPPFNDSAVYNQSTNMLTITASVMLPNVENITVEQYYSREDATKLQLCITYMDTLDPLTTFFTAPLTFNALPINDTGGLHVIKSVELILQDKDPKTSRGTVTTVAHSGS
jgi:hypothetical protein